jgi:hypothetical protein
MNARALHGFDWSRLRPTKAQRRRACVAGGLFGATLTAGFAAMSAWQCGGVCLPEVAVNFGLSVAAGIFCIGPIAAYGGRRR